jgi:hypothetical protein
VVSEWLRVSNVETRYENVSTDTKEKRKCKWSRDEMFWPIEKRICKMERAWIRVRGHSFFGKLKHKPFPLASLAHSHS